MAYIQALEGNIIAVSMSAKPDAPIIGTLDAFVAERISGEFFALVNDARCNPTEKVYVPNITHAKGIRPRNYGALQLR